MTKALARVPAMEAIKKARGKDVDSARVDHLLRRRIRHAGRRRSRQPAHLRLELGHHAYSGQEKPAFRLMGSHDSCKTEPDAAAPAAARATCPGTAHTNRTGFICEMTRDQRTIQLDDLDAWPSGSAGGWVRSFVLLVDAVVSTTDSRSAGVDSQSSERIQHGRSHEELGCAGGPVFTRA